MVVDLTPEECNSIEDALAYAEVQHERRAEIAKKLLNAAESDAELRTAKSLRDLWTKLMKARVEGSGGVEGRTGT